MLTSLNEIKSNLFLKWAIYIYILETIKSQWLFQLHLQLQFNTFYSTIPVFHICTLLLWLLSSISYLWICSNLLCNQNRNHVECLFCLWLATPPLVAHWSRAWYALSGSLSWYNLPGLAIYFLITLYFEIVLRLTRRCKNRIPMYPSPSFPQRQIVLYTTTVHGQN